MVSLKICSPMLNETCATCQLLQLKCLVIGWTLISFNLSVSYYTNPNIMCTHWSKLMIWMDFLCHPKKHYNKFRYNIIFIRLYWDSGGWSLAVIVMVVGSIAWVWDWNFEIFFPIYLHCFSPKIIIIIRWRVNLEFKNQTK